MLEPGVSYDSSTYREWLRLVADQGIEYNLARAGQEIDLGNGIKIEVLGPSPPAEVHLQSSPVKGQGERPDNPAKKL